MELKLKNVTSYSKENYTKINLTKKINIIYGQNGSGKSTISNFFYKIGDALFSDCECTLIEQYRPLVYNTKFIEENFYNTSEQKGVFTLSKENAEIEKEIIEKEALKQKLTEQYKDKKSSRDKAVQNGIHAESICIESIWFKTENLRSSSLKLLMRGSLGSKRNFYEKLSKAIRLPNIDLEVLAREYEELLKHRNNESPILTSPIRKFLNANEHELLATPIIDLSNSYLSENIKKLQNLDWVKRGKELYITDDTCPFCQEKTISSDFIKAIESIFDETYSTKLSQINSIRDNLTRGMGDNLQNIQNEIAQCSFINEEERDKSIKTIKLLWSNLDKNTALINNKIKNPSISISLLFDEESFKSITTDIALYNRRIIDLNEKAKNFKKSEGEILGKIWAGAKDYCHSDFESLGQFTEKNKKEIEDLDREIGEITKNGKEIGSKIQELRANISNIDITIDSINKRLENLGIDSFCIKKHTKAEDKYIIARTDNPLNENVYRSLSEGEKTLITFLYFLEYCKGKTDKSDSDNREPLIVIDDPISSLSQNYIYDIASMIHFEVLEDKSPRKIIILTHNLYFFHELVKLAPKKDKVFKRDYNLGRVSKNTNSIFNEIERNSLQNEYQSLWQILKDAQDGKINKIIIPNIMRNILEYYFAFVHKTDALQTELINLAKDEGNENFRAFYRFINRGSHSDSVNISDMGDISPQKYMEQLKKIFTKTGDVKHYLKMMEEEDNDEEGDVATA
ncbi:AAA family ATPase [Yersinia ruckeri]|uniref:AAA family ATPase n=1 Tax=Yersinia TaxID=629 RepID=UPI000EB2BFAC|nr:MULTISPECIES: AAA family ATPase [Yersinia]UZX55241.1 AAA family ATPase [Yersinia ruckeri]